MVRKLRIGFIIVAGIIAASTGLLSAAPWSLVSCDPANAKGWQAFAQAMKAAAPGSPLYVPYPFPATPDQAVQDFLQQYWTLIRGLAPSQWQPAESRVMTDLSSGAVTFQVMRVEDWTLSRCGKQQEQDHFLLVRAFEPAGVEVVRGVLLTSGLLGTWNEMPANVPGPVASQSRLLPPAADAMAKLNAELGLNGIDAEYVATGGTINCLLTHPCLAFRQSGLSYVAWSTDVYEISADGPVLTSGKEVNSRAGEALLHNLPAGEGLFSLGGKRYTIGRKVDAATIRSGKSAFHP